MNRGDESYIIGICDRVLNCTAERNYRFDFLMGDAGKDGRCRKLPVDAYYKELSLVIEYWESQHTESNTFFDKNDRVTCSGVHRGEQRRIYDARRRQILPRHGIHLVVLGYKLFEHNSKKRLLRNETADEAIIRKELSRFLKQNNP
jgi:hypothetical protein